MTHILFLAHRVPFPPDRGDKIRSHHILQRLAELAPVHVATFAERESELKYGEELGRLARTHCLTMRSKPLPLAGMQALASGAPVSLAAFDDRRLRRYVHRVLKEYPVDTIYVFSGQMGQYVPPEWQGRLIVDLVDVDSAKFESYAGESRLPLRWLYSREGRLLAHEEARLSNRASTTLLISQDEADLFRTRLDHAGADIQVLGNGTDTAFFDPAIVTPDAGMMQQEGPHIVFAGQMDYPPNVAAGLRLVERIMPALRKVHPEARCHIVGRGPVAALRRHDGRDGCRIWGEVADIRPVIAGADLAIIPLSIARGVQNKVLEAMAMARPVVLTPEAAAGIDAVDGENFATAASDDAIVSRALELLADPARANRMGAAARQQVCASHSWAARLAALPAILGCGENDATVQSHAA